MTTEKAVTDASLLGLPLEIREQILQLALFKENGAAIALQTACGCGGEEFAQPLFSVCRMLRAEALKSFYHVNLFTWNLNLNDRLRDNVPEWCRIYKDISVTRRSASSTEDYDPFEESCFGGDPMDQPSSLTALLPSLPADYPYLKQHVRRLEIIIYIPLNYIANDLTKKAWETLLPQALQKLQAALDFGRRLDMLCLRFQMLTHCDLRPPFTKEQLATLEILAKMEVRGSTHVSIQKEIPQLARDSLEGLDLARQLTA